MDNLQNKRVKNPEEKQEANNNTKTDYEEERISRQHDAGLSPLANSADTRYISYRNSSSSSSSNNNNNNNNKNIPDRSPSPPPVPPNRELPSNKPFSAILREKLVSEQQENQEVLNNKKEEEIAVQNQNRLVQEQSLQKTTTTTNSSSSSLSSPPVQLSQKDQGNNIGHQHDEDLEDGIVNNSIGDEEEPLNKTRGHDQNSKSNCQYYRLHEDTFSLFFVAGMNSIEFYYAVGTFLFQMTILVLIVYDLLVDDSVEGGMIDSNNFFRAPVYVNKAVSAAQALALIVAVVSQDDALTALDSISVDYDDTVLNKYPGATRTKWYFSNILRFLEGFLTIFTSFIFIVQSSSVLDIFLNFVAVEFIAHIDNIAFTLALRGYVKGIKMANDVKTMKFAQYHNGNRRIFVRRFIFYFLLLALVAGWLTIYIRQTNGYYLETTACNSFSIKFGDEFFNINRSLTSNDVFDFNGTNTGEPTLRYYLSSDLEPLPSPLLYAAFSGTYLTRKERKNNRFVYFEDIGVEGNRNATDPTLGRFSFCSKLHAWVFEVEALNKVISNDVGCEHTWLLRSPKSESFLLEDVQTTGWKIRSDGILSFTTDFTFVCNACTSNDDCNNNGQCNGEGQCLCKDGFLGNQCEIQTPCNTLRFFDYGSSALEFSTEDLGTFSLFNMTRTTTNSNVNFLTSYGRPVYITDPVRVYSDAINATMTENDSDGKLMFTPEFDDMFAFNNDCQGYLDEGGFFRGTENCTITVYSLAESEPDNIDFVLKFDVDGNLYFEDVYAAVYTGGRWYGVISYLTSFINRFIDEPFHGYWDLGTLQEGERFNILYVSEPTDSGTPINLEWNEISNSKSVGDFGPFGSTIRVPSIVHCADVDCDIENICGNQGICERDENNFGFCRCEGCYGGYFCQYDPRGPYANDAFLNVHINNKIGGNYYREFWKGIEGCDPLLQNTTTLCREDESVLHIDITPDDCAHETSWQINVNNEPFVGPYALEFNEGMVICVPKDSCVEFIIVDVFGDGICCENGFGQYKLYLDQVEVASGGEFEDREAVTLTNCTA